MLHSLQDDFALARDTLLYLLRELVDKELFSSIRRREAAQTLTGIMLSLALGFELGK